MLSRFSRPRAGTHEEVSDASARPHQPEVLPLFRRGAAAESFAGFEHQLERLEAEAGVRPQL